MTSRRLVTTFGLALAVCTSGCILYNIDNSVEAAALVEEQDIGTFPYHPVVYHLDLSILIYQLYTQSLVWPFDPYYEELARQDEDARNEFMNIVRDWAERTGEQQQGGFFGLDEYRGPGLLSGFDDNPLHDPIVYQYSRLHPWSRAVSNPVGTWTEYFTPTVITDQIAEVQVCMRRTGANEGDVSVQTLFPVRNDSAPDAQDVLLAIEGGTGDKGEPGQPHSHSLMALALLRDTGNDGYDVHIAFRGSRSGDGARAATEALATVDASGNPDWVTDLGYREVSARYISTVGEVSRGMSRSMRSIFPQLFTCLDSFGGVRDRAPDNIFVTGHSLGGALAQHFASAVLLGDWYGPDGDKMPESLIDWPWASLKLITFSAPRVGNADWANTLTIDHLESEPYGRSILGPYDPSAVGITDRNIVPRLTNADRPASFRVLVHTDPVTTGKIPGGLPLGQTVYLHLPGPADHFAPPDVSGHEPINVRQAMLNNLRDVRIPPFAWAYTDMDDFVEDRDPDAAGTVEEYEKLLNATVTYYAEQDAGFDRSALEQSFTTFVELLDER